MAELGRSRAVAGGGTASRQTSTLLLPGIQASQVRGLEMRPPLLLRPPPIPWPRRDWGSAPDTRVLLLTCVLSRLGPETSLRAHTEAQRVRGLVQGDAAGGGAGTLPATPKLSEQHSSAARKAKCGVRTQTTGQPKPHPMRILPCPSAREGGQPQGATVHFQLRGGGYHAGNGLQGSRACRLRGWGTSRGPMERRALHGVSCAPPPLTLTAKGNRLQGSVVLQQGGFLLLWDRAKERHWDSRHQGSRPQARAGAGRLAPWEKAGAVVTGTRVAAPRARGCVQSSGAEAGGAGCGPPHSEDTG